MKKLILLSALLVSFTFTHAQNIDKLKKRELRELANTQKQQLLVKNNKIDDQANIILNSSARISELIQIKTQLENFKLSSLDSINKLNTSINNLSNKNAIIPGLKNEIIKLTDSINSINNLLSSGTSQASFSINQNSYGFLNNLYLGNDRIENQTFRLVPAGVLARNNLIDHGGYSYDRDADFITRFIPMTKLKIGIEEKKNTFLSQGTSLKNFKKIIKDNFKWILGVELYNLYPEIFPTFSFLKGKLLTITNENVSKDFLFSVKEKSSVESLNDQLGQKGVYFSLTDDNEIEYLLELIVINNEVYLRINSRNSGSHNNSLEKIGMKWSVTHSYNSKVVKYWTTNNGYERSDSKGMNSSDDDFTDDYYKYQAEYYLECDQFYISPWLVPSTYESSVKITPDMFLFKLEEI
jgi:hypothetical protein